MKSNIFFSLLICSLFSQNFMFGMNDGDINTFNPDHKETRPLTQNASFSGIQQTSSFEEFIFDLEDPTGKQPLTRQTLHTQTPGFTPSPTTSERKTPTTPLTSDAIAAFYQRLINKPRQSSQTPNGQS